MKKTSKQPFSIRETIDIAFLLLSFIFFLVLYWFAFDIFYPDSPGQSADSRYGIVLLLIYGCLIFSLLANIIVQTIFNIEKTTIKIKAYTFCFISVIDIGFMLFIHERLRPLAFVALVLKIINAFLYYRLISETSACTDFSSVWYTMKNRIKKLIL